MSYDSFEKIEIEISSEIATEDMVKQDNLECPVCLSHGIGVKLPNCQHYICTICYYIIYEYGYLSDDFLQHHKSPVEPVNPKEPKYPYINKTELLEEIYTNLQLEGKFKELFIEDNEDLYECFKMGHYKDKIIEKWIKNNELINQYELDKKTYEKDMKKYNKEFNSYSKQYQTYLELKQQDRESNINPCCPLCRK